MRERTQETAQNRKQAIAPRKTALTESGNQMTRKNLKVPLLVSATVFPPKAWCASKVSRATVDRDAVSATGRGGAGRALRQPLPFVPTFRRREVRDRTR